MPIVRLSEIEDPRLSIYQDVRHTNLTRWSGKFIAEGWRVVERLVTSRLEIESILISERRGEEFGPFFDRLDPALPIYLLDQKLGEQLVGYNFHAGVLACGYRPPEVTLEELAGMTEGTDIPVRDNSDSPRLLVWCPGLSMPENLGTIIRLCAAFRVDGILVGPQSPDPYSRRVVRTSMGNIFALPVREVRDPEAELRWLRERGFDIYATVLEEGAVALDEITPGPRSVVVFGNEAEGLPEALRALATRQVTIPISSEVDSLNVSHAAAICLYHFTRRLGQV